ncbi:MAG: sigma 54-interacting transcriptional regulator, partial [Spirochaetes bacterium]|nr:sigma 54-interacting transcriptional regulator [Spirochaetota bacterium]
MVYSDKKLEALNSILISLNHSDSPEEMLNYLIDNCIRITHATSGSIMLINPKTGILEIKVIRGLKKDVIKNVLLRIGEGVTGKVAQTGTPLLIGNVEKVDYYIRIRKDLKSELAVPLIINKEIIGVLNVDSIKINAFTEEDLNLLQLVSNIVVQILKKENIIYELKDKIDQQILLLKIAKVLEAPTKLEEIFHNIMDILSSAFPIKRGMLLLLTMENKLRIFQGYRLSEEAIQKGVYEIGEGIIGKAVKKGEPICIENIFTNSEFLNKMKIRRSNREISSFFAVPIKYNNKTGGVLSIEKKFTDETNFQSTKETLILISSLISHKVANWELMENEKNELIAKNRELTEKLGIKDNEPLMIGNNKKIREILEMIKIIADTDAAILITGDTGTGKEVLARKIHYSSNRSSHPFIGINCAAIPGNLLESELFGYKKGAFTGAGTDKKGKFVLADKGTIFLDEIGDLDFNLQSKLLRVIQEKQIEPLGSESSIHVDIRIITATNKDLPQLVKEEKFREDLYYRINVISLHVPSLTQRKDDIPFLINHFIAKYNKKYDKRIKDITPNCLRTLVNYEWPGNIRELENIIERAIILSTYNMIDEAVLPENIIKSEGDDSRLENFLLKEVKITPIGNIHKNIMEKVEKFLIDHALISHNNKQTEASQFLGIHRNTMREKIKYFNMLK